MEILWKEGAKPQVSPMFHRAVVQTVLIFGEETWVLSEAISSNLEEVHMGFLNQITGQREVQQEDGTWRQVEEKKVLEKAESHSLGNYIERIHATVAEWVELRPILEVCDREVGYEGGGSLQDPWLR